MGQNQTRWGDVGFGGIKAMGAPRCGQRGVPSSESFRGIAGVCNVFIMKASAGRGSWGRDARQPGGVRIWRRVSLSVLYRMVCSTGDGDAAGRGGRLSTRRKQWRYAT